MQKFKSVSSQTQASSKKPHGRKELSEAALKAKAVLKTINKVSLRTLRNQVINRAIKRIENRWIKGAMRDYKENEGFCMVGAIREKVNGETEFPRSAVTAAMVATAAIIDPGGGLPSYTIIDFNDDDNRRKPQVLKVLKEAKKQPVKK